MHIFPTGMKIAAFEGFYGGSHRQWLDGLAANSSHYFEIFGLPDRFWKWRMHGAAVTLAPMFMESGYSPDLLLVTDMIDLNLLLSLTRNKTGSTPVVLYMHENQINYPWSDIDRDVQFKRDHHYGFINYASALASDAVLFNSEYHKNAFLGSLPAFLKMFPDYRNSGTVDVIEQKSKVMPVGVDLQGISAPDTHSRRSKEPTILWNHRWEYDKGPEVFFNTLFELSDNGARFKLICCGEATDSYPPIFDEAERRLAKHVLHWGYAGSRENYYDLLHQADILPVTSNQDFFGISVVEAMHCGVYPLLPDRLAFPEHIPQDKRHAHLYASPSELHSKLNDLLSSRHYDCDAKSWVERYDWQMVIDDYDGFFGRFMQ